MFYLSVLSLFLFLGCSQIQVNNEGIVAAYVEERLNMHVHWNQGSQEDGYVAEAVQSLLEQDLTLESAIQVALLNNPEIQASFEELGIAQAELVQAGLLRNPLFEFYGRLPHTKQLHTNIEISILQSFLDVLLIPLRTKVAEAELEQTQCRVAMAVLNLSYQVEETYFKLIYEKERQKILQDLASIAEAASELAMDQVKAGTINTLTQQARLNAALQARLALSEASMEITKLKEQLSKLLGVTASSCLRLNSDLKFLPEQEQELECIETIGLSKRLDLLLGRLEVEKKARMLGVKQWWSYTDLAAGLAYEREPEGESVKGPALTGSIPIFNWGQADRARLWAEINQESQRLKSLEIHILSEIREAKALVDMNRALAFDYKNILMPLQARILEESQLYYNAMDIGVYDLLDKKANEYQTQLNYLTTLKNYWLAKVALDKALGGNIDLLKNSANELKA